MWVEGKAPKKEPDYVDPSYEKFYLPKARRFLQALAERYDKPASPVMLWGAMVMDSGVSGTRCGRTIPGRASR